MQQLENNSYFWQKMDTLLLSNDCNMDHPKGSSHQKYPNLIYPVDLCNNLKIIHIFGKKWIHCYYQMIVIWIIQKEVRIKNILI